MVICYNEIERRSNLYLYETKWIGWWHVSILTLSRPGRLLHYYITLLAKPTCIYNVYTHWADFTFWLSPAGPTLQIRLYNLPLNIYTSVHYILTFIRGVQHSQNTLWSYNNFNTEKLTKTIQAFHSGEEWFRRHDPKVVVWSYMNVYGIPWPYTHTTFSDQEPGTRALN